MIVDYGYTERPLRSTLDAWSNHKYVSIFKTPGLVDVTADVDFLALRKTAENRGIIVDGPITQVDFIKTMGVTKRAEILKKDVSVKVKMAIEKELHRLTDPRGLGKNFKGMMMRSQFKSEE